MKLMWIFLIVFSSVILIGAWLFFPQKQTSQEKATSIITNSNCDNLINNMERDSCYFNLAEEKNNVSLCLKINDTWKRRDCIGFLT